MSDQGRQAPRALIVRVDEGSPADDAGFSAGCFLTHANGVPLRDIIEWRWQADGPCVTVRYIDLDGDAGEVELWREEGEDWGFHFDGFVFDQVLECRNACTFCFMRMLPEGVRPSLVLRDDDYRLSFMSGTFATFTNLGPEDEARIVEQRISPLRWSLHAVDPGVRARLMGRHAPHGLAAAQRLLDAGIQMDAQVVLVPGENDGDVLRETLEWCWERPGVQAVGVVPLGFTRFQSRFDRSFDDPADARAVLELLAPFQRRAQEAGRGMWAFAADEFYCNAYGDDVLVHLPAADAYGDFEMFDDGIGMVRLFADDWASCAHLQERAARQMADTGTRVLLVAGQAQRGFLAKLVQESPLAGWLVPLFVTNRHFGGNVDVTGLLCADDIADALRIAAAQLREHGAPVSYAAVPSVVFNDRGLTLDDRTCGDISAAAGLPAHVVPCQGSQFLPQLLGDAAFLA